MTATMLSSRNLHGFKPSLGFIVLVLLLFGTASAQDCSATKLCSTGCCSKFGFCGTGEDFCGPKSCVSTCDYKLGCDASNPCKAGQGCCSKFGFCGLGPDYCAPDICVAGCKEKAYCNPGYEVAGYAEVEDCPLSVCCSKFGFCGLTKEFCGEKTVKRPSCSTSGTLSRVVGYYEGWANHRRCQSFWPNQIPLGVYTHINFAFATIHPSTFEVLPASSNDIDLYTQVTNLKLQQPDLKVYIAIGGWTFNDPGSTASTFSDLAGSLTNQAKFFASLISFMSTYNFDGVDIDWEYPEADDRSGRPSDFVNFPTFIANLKSTLSASGGRDGLSITLPASYWYLRHFDIKKLVNSVDFFNMMTYDLHGLWDRDSKWLGPYLNAHTNLTEITTALDLLWRNDISPDKVVLGLAFYARTFTLSNTACTVPGCMFASAGTAGLCTDSVGILSNGEIASMITENMLTPIHYKDAAVKVITWGDQWIAYDDKDTYQQKADFAKSQCLGGLMVWALSQDSADLASSDALAKTATRTMSLYKTEVKASIPDDGSQTGHSGPAPTETVTTSQKIDQCMWTTCGQGCPSGYNNVPRSDEYKRDGESMQDSTYCGSGTSLRQFCCPVAAHQPTCGWYNFFNGRCSSDFSQKLSCPVGTVEIGSNSHFCDNAQAGGYQQACCTYNSNAMQLYSQCVWNGIPGSCNKASLVGYSDGGCSASRTTHLVDSHTGSGAVGCVKIISTTRPYCCAQPMPDKQFSNCAWYSVQGGVPKGRDSSKWCQSGCPLGKIRVSMDGKTKDCANGSAKAYCCDPVNTYEVVTTTVNPELAAYKAAIASFFLSTECTVGSNKRSDHSSLAMNHSLEVRHELSETINNRDIDKKPSVIIAALLYALLTKPEDSTLLLQAEKELWDAEIGRLYKNLKLHELRTYLETDPVYKHYPLTSASNTIPCSLNAWNNRVKANTTSTNLLTCFHGNLSAWDPDFFKDDLDYSESFSSIKRSLVLRGHSGVETANLQELDRRDGASRTYSINLGTDANGQPIIIFLVSWSFPNGRGGSALLDATGSTSRYTLANPHKCTDTTMTSTAVAADAPAWVTEHIFELQTVARMLEFLVLGRLPQVTSSGGLYPFYVPEFNTGFARNLFPPWVLTDWFQKPYEDWPPGAITYGTKGRPDTRFMEAVGSKTNPGHLVVCDAVTNSVKAHIVKGEAPISDATWKKSGFGNTNQASAEAAFSALRAVLSVYQYLNMRDINGHFQTTYRGLRASMLEFQVIFNQNSILHGLQISTLPLMDEFIGAWANRMTFFTRQWLDRHLATLRSSWTYVFQTTTDATQRNLAEEILRMIGELEIEAEATSFQAPL